MHTTTTTTASLIHRQATHCSMSAVCFQPVDVMQFRWGCWTRRGCVLRCFRHRRRQSDRPSVASLRPCFWCQAANETFLTCFQGSLFVANISPPVTFISSYVDVWRGVSPSIVYVIMPLSAVGHWRHLSFSAWEYYQKFVSTISYKPLVGILPYLQLGCSWGQIWTD